MKQVFIIIGVSGSGKSTVGKLLADELSLPFYDADDFHSDDNIRKMATGIPLEDEDRIPWLETLSEEIGGWSDNGAVLACSALKESYRTMLQQNASVQWVILNGSFELIESRLKERSGHYMGFEMLRSQFDDFELPGYGIHLDIRKNPKDLVGSILKHTVGPKHSEFGIIGLGVMGKNLAKNMLSKGISLSVFNRPEGDEATVVSDFIAENKTPLLQGFTDYRAFVKSLETPRKILLMIPAGPVVDSVIYKLQPHLKNHDIILDGGNSHFEHTNRRFEYARQLGIDFIGLGISGGAEGALKGPSLMAGGSEDAYKKVKPMLAAIAARDENDIACLSLLGPQGAGHFVKMVHNGIEYAEMQLLAEVYALLKHDHDNEEIAKLLADWYETELSGYLLKITIDILRFKENDGFLVDKILDKAASKGTGGWSSKASIELGSPATMMSEALFARYVSGLKGIRSELDKGRLRSSVKINPDSLRDAYQFARLVNHYQGFYLLRNASEAYNWHLDLSEIARIWTAGCIIKSNLMRSIQKRFSAEAFVWTQQKLVSDLYQKEAAIKEVVVSGTEKSTALPCLSAALQFWLGLSTGESAANLIQAQRDYFGNHTYKRTDSEGNHTTNWQSDG